MSQDVGILLASERSGTHMLRSMLSKTKGISSPGEVCNVASDSIRTSDTSFLKYREQACSTNHDFFYATAAVQTRLLDEYFAHVRMQFPKKKLVILDIKYAHVHNFNSFWWDIISRPFLIDYAVQRRIKLIHLVREKSYQTAISGIYAQQSGVWRTQDKAEIRSTKITINRDSLENRVRRLVEGIRLFDQWLIGTNCVRITYEELTEVASTSLTRLSEFLEIDEKICEEPGFVKTTPPYEEVIENFGEISHLIDLTVAASKPDGEMG